MNGFVRTLIYGFAAIGVLLLTAGVTTLWSLRHGGELNRDKLRALVMTDEERAWIAQMRRAPAEKPAAAPAERPADAEEMLAQIAELANAQRASQLVADLRRTRATLDEEKLHLERQAAEIAQARTDLQRVADGLARERQELADQRKAMAAEQGRWAAAQADEAKKVQAMDEVERARLREQARLFEQMKDGAWQTLRRLEPREIARYLALMDPKKAARMLILAQQDAENPSLVLAIHREMRRLDLDGATGDQLDRLARLYAFMPPAQVVAYLKGSAPEEVAGLLRRMAAAGDKRRADLLTAIRAEDPARELAVQRLLAAAEPPPAAER